MVESSSSPVTGELPVDRPPPNPADPAAKWDETVRSVASERGAGSSTSSDATTVLPVNSTGPTLAASGAGAAGLIPAPSSAGDPLLTSRPWSDFISQQATSFKNGAGTFADHVAEIHDYLVARDPARPNPGSLNDPAQSLSYLTDNIETHTKDVESDFSTGFEKFLHESAFALGQSRDSVLDKLHGLQNPGSDPTNPAGRSLSAIAGLTANNSQVLRFTAADVAIPSSVPGLKYTGNLRATLPLSAGGPSARTSVDSDLVLNVTAEVGGGTAATPLGALSGGLEVTTQLAWHKDETGKWGPAKVNSITAQANADANMSSTVRNGLFAGMRYLNSVFNPATNNGVPQEVALQTFNTSENPLFEVGAGEIAAQPNPNAANPLFQVQNQDELNDWFATFGASAPGPRAGLKVEPWSLGEASLGVSWVRDPTTDTLESVPGVANLTFKHFDGLKVAAGAATPGGYGLGTDVRAFNAVSTGLGFAWTAGGVKSLESNSYWSVNTSLAGQPS